LENDEKNIKLSGCHDSENKNDQVYCQRVPFDEKSLMIMVFFSKHGGNNESSSILIFRYLVYFYFLSDFGVFQGC
jgi:hypothetical protein